MSGGLGSGYNFGGDRSQTMRARLRQLARANAERRPCPHCGTPISAGGFAHHVMICGDAA